MDTVPEATTGFQLKLAVVVLLAASVSLFDVALVAGLLGNGDPSGALSTAGVLLVFLVLATAIVIPLLIWRDAHAVRDADRWHPRPWFWAITPYLFYGIPALVYLGLRYHHVGDLGRPLFGTWEMEATEETEARSDRVETWGFRLKVALLLLLFTALFAVAAPAGTPIATLSFGAAYLAVVAAVWFDTRAVREQGSWDPEPWSWTLLTLLLHCLPALPYLVFRARRIGSTGASVSERVPAIDRDSTESERDRTLERADEHLERANELLDEGAVIEARDAYEDAKSTYIEARRLANTTPSRAAPRIQHRIGRARRGIETCWLRAFENRLDEAEEDLAAGDHESARESFEQVRAALDQRTFDHRDTEALEHRVMAGIQACGEEPTD